MSIRMHHLLAQWYSQRDMCDWVLGTIIGTERSAYRKAGAMMLFSERGQRLGMLSGGCLEDNLMREASKALALNAPHSVTYDLELDAEDPENWREAIGCGGAVTIVLQVLNSDNDYLGLAKVHEHLQAQQAVLYRQRIDELGLGAQHWSVTTLSTARYRNYCHTVEDGVGKFLETAIFPAPQLVILGGGMDAVPLSRLACDIGWQVSVVDERTRYAQAADFKGATVYQHSMDALSKIPTLASPDAIVIMTHNLKLDAAALKYASQTAARYVGILGPEHRRQKVEIIAGLRPDDFIGAYRGPAGLEIGASLPETIALAILAECHQFIEGDRQTSCSGETPAKKPSAIHDTMSDKI